MPHPEETMRFKSEEKKEGKNFDALMAAARRVPLPSFFVASSFSMEISQ